MNDIAAWNVNGFYLAKNRWYVHVKEPQGGKAYPVAVSPGYLVVGADPMPDAGDEDAYLNRMHAENMHARAMYRPGFDAITEFIEYLQAQRSADV